MSSLLFSTKHQDGYFRTLGLPPSATTKAGLRGSYVERDTETLRMKRLAQVSQTVWPPRTYRVNMKVLSTPRAAERKSHLRKEKNTVIDRERWERYCDELLNRIAANQQALAVGASHLERLHEASQGHLLPGTAKPLYTWLQPLLGLGPVPGDDVGDDGTYRLRLCALADLLRLTGDRLSQLARDVGALRSTPGTRAAFRQRELAHRRLGRAVDGLAWHFETAARMVARARTLQGERRAVVCRDLRALVENLEYKIFWHFELSLDCRADTGVAWGSKRRFC